MRPISKQLVTRWIPKRDKNIHKGDMGRVLCVGGSQGMGGSIILSAMAALYSGAGLITVASDPTHKTALLIQAPEIMFSDMYDILRLKELVIQANVIVIGPGLGLDDRARRILRTVLGNPTKEQTVIVDADAITLISKDQKLAETKANLIYTPHAGEWSRLIGEDITDTALSTKAVRSNKTFRDNLEAIVVLKGAPTKVYFKDDIWQNTTGNPGQATGGMGDTLAGMIAGFVAQDDNIEKAVLSAVFTHSYIADQLAETHYVTLPTEIIRHIPTTLRSLSNESKPNRVTRV